VVTVKWTLAAATATTSGRLAWIQRPGSGRAGSRDQAAAASTLRNSSGQAAGASADQIAASCAIVDGGARRPTCGGGIATQRPASTSMNRAPRLFRR
jgi:hypothetical protein